MLEQTPSVQTGIPALNSVINPVIGSSLAPAPGASANPLQIWISVFTAVWIAGRCAASSVFRRQLWPAALEAP